MGMRVSVVAGGVGEPGRPPRSLCVHSPLQVAAAVVEEQPQADQQPSAAPTEAAASLPLPPAPLPLSSPSTTGQQPAEVSPLQAAASGGIGVLDQHGLLDVAAVAAPEEFDLLGDLGALLPLQQRQCRPRQSQSLPALLTCWAIWTPPWRLHCLWQHSQRETTSSGRRWGQPWRSSRQPATLRSRRQSNQQRLQQRMQLRHLYRRRLGWRRAACQTWRKAGMRSAQR